MRPGDATAHEGLSVSVDATPLLGVRTGVGEFCLGALQGLGADPDVDVRAFAVSWRRRQMLAPLVPPGVRVHQRAMPARPLHMAWRHLPVPPLEWFVSQSDVVHGTNFVVPPTRRAGRVVTVHDLTPLRFPEMCDGPSLAYPRLVRRAIDAGAWVHTPSRFVADEVVAEFGADPARVRVVYHGIPTRPRAGPDAGILGVALPPGTRRYILAVGTVEPRKDLPGLVRAFDRLAGDHLDVALVLVGPPGWGSDALSSALDSARFAGRVVRTGYLSDDTLAQVLARATVLAYPSRYEGFGFPPLEAMAAGVAVVATAAGAVPEVVGDAAVLVAPGDPDALAAALEKVIDDEDMRGALIEAGHQRAGQFTWTACAAGLVELYEAAACR